MNTPKKVPSTLLRRLTRLVAVLLSLTLTYDAVGRVKTKADPVGTQTSTYDAEGNLTTLAEGAANITRNYDDLGRLTSVTDAQGNVIGYSYDNVGNLLTLTYPGGKIVTYTYDAANRLKTVKDWSNRVTTYTYDAAGLLTQVDRPNSTRQRLTYDAANRITGTYEEKMSGTTVAGSLWQASYGFDNAYRLTSFTATPMGKTTAPPTTAMTVDADNQLATYNGTTVNHDLDGNLLSAPVNGTLLGALTWDKRNRLLTGGGITNTYDAESRRSSSALAGQTTRYTWSRGQLDRLLVKQNPDGSLTRYIYGAGLLYEETTNASNIAQPIVTYHFDWRGDTIALSDSTGTVTARISYSPYGEETIESGKTQVLSTPFRFNGRFGVMTDANGLLSMQARFYSPIYRRFLNEDPSGFAGGLNLYAYAGGDPIDFMDPFGLGPSSGSFWNDAKNGLNSAANYTWGDMGSQVVSFTRFMGDQNPWLGNTIDAVNYNLPLEALGPLGGMEMGIAEGLSSIGMAMRGGITAANATARAETTALSTYRSTTAGETLWLRLAPAIRPPVD